MIINNNNIYNVTHENSKNNYEKLTVLLSDFLKSNNLKISDIGAMYINRGPGSFAGIRNSLSMIKAIHMVKKLTIIVSVLKTLIMKLMSNTKIYRIFAVNLI